MTEKRILLIDDSELVIDLVDDALKAAGIVLAAAKDLADLEKKLAAERPDLVLVDVQMPEAFGDDVAMILRAGRGVNVPIYLFSNLDDEELEQRASAAGLEGFISKRGGVDALVDRLEKLIDARRAPRPRGFERFLPKFLTAAQARLARGAQLVAADNATAAFAELHALAGEAAILGLGDLAKLAREGELAAKRWREADPGTGDAHRASCEESLKGLGAALAALSAKHGSTPAT
jgi:DNA-binding NarL/FixJ family response regulator